MGNLADELGDLDDEEEIEDDVAVGEDGEEVSAVDGARDSGIDVSYESRRGSPAVKNFSKPFAGVEKPPDRESVQDKLSTDMEDLISAVGRMASYAESSEDPLVPRFVALLQDLGNQSALEMGVQRMNTSTNSMTSHLASQTKTLQSLATSLYSPLALHMMPLDPELIEETTPLIEMLLQDLPLPDTAPLQGLQKLCRDTDSTIHTLSQLTDTLQMGKHITNEASRHLRNTQRMVAELRRERERADVAREELARGGWHDRVGQRWCGGECKDIMDGFERQYMGLREALVQRA